MVFLHCCAHCDEIVNCPNGIEEHKICDCMYFIWHLEKLTPYVTVVFFCDKTCYDLWKIDDEVEDESLSDCGDENCPIRACELSDNSDSSN